MTLRGANGPSSPGGAAGHFVCIAHVCWPFMWTACYVLAHLRRVLRTPVPGVFPIAKAKVYAVTVSHDNANTLRTQSQAYVPMQLRSLRKPDRAMRARSRINPVGWIERWMGPPVAPSMGMRRVRDDAGDDAGLG